MIPKIIHYCWFGPNNFPKTVENCIQSWKEYLPNYKFILWNESNSPMEHQFVRSAYKAKKYAFVADYVRLWALYKYGGIYLDTDMFVVKHFNELISNEIFFGYETEKQDYISAGIIGSTPYHNFINNMLEQYDDLTFTKDDIKSLKIPGLITEQYSIYKDSNKIKIYPYDFFYPFPYSKRDEHLDFLTYRTSNTIAIHLWDKSWFTWKDRLTQIRIALVKRLFRIINK